jgi:dihydrodipicolinate synthase/N-acetylneuraminate lyase
MTAPGDPRLTTTATERVRIPPMRLGRSIDGISAVLLPFTRDDAPDWDGFRTLLDRTWSAGLTPAVNMDTGYVNLLTREERRRALADTSEAARGRRFVASAFIEGETGDPATLYLRAVEEIRRHGGTPILFQSSALGALDERAALDVYRRVGHAGEPLLAFELGPMFAPFGRIHTADFFRALLEVPAFVGLKHSSLSRTQEWRRLEIRDRHRPGFRLYTGNDLAIDMVWFGSDYLLGLSAFHVEAFAVRDGLWASSDARAFELNDELQHLGLLTFRDPVPGYKHSAAQFLHARGVIATDRPHPRGQRRPASDGPLLAEIAGRIDAALARIAG